MADGIYLEDHPPVSSQFRTTRRATVTGALVVHTAENNTDTSLPDGGAEAVARFISTRTNAGSYHSVVDSDSIVHVGRYEWEMFHEGTGGNRWSLGLSFACMASQWPILPAQWVSGAIENGALEAATMAAWVRSTVGVSVPARRISPAQYRAGQPGFISHAELDPGRRSDPGAEFPWTTFLQRFAHHAGVDPPMPTEWCVPANRKPVIEESQQVLKDAGFYSGPIDGDWFTASNSALHALKNDRNALTAQRDAVIAERNAVITQRDALQQSLDTANGVIAELTARLENQSGATQRLATARSNLIGFATALGVKIEPVDEP